MEDKEKTRRSLLRRIQFICYSVVMVIVSYVLIFYGKPAFLNHDIAKAKLVYGGTAALGFLGAFIVVPFTRWLCNKLIDRREKKGD